MHLEDDSSLRYSNTRNMTGSEEKNKIFDDRPGSSSGRHESRSNIYNPLNTNFNNNNNQNAGAGHDTENVLQKDPKSFQASHINAHNRPYNFQASHINADSRNTANIDSGPSYLPTSNPLNAQWAGSHTRIPNPTHPNPTQTYAHSNLRPHIHETLTGHQPPKLIQSTLSPTRSEKSQMIRVSVSPLPSRRSVSPNLPFEPKTQRSSIPRPTSGPHGRWSQSYI